MSTVKQLREEIVALRLELSIAKDSLADAMLVIAQIKRHNAPAYRMSPERIAAYFAANPGKRSATKAELMAFTL